MKNKFLILALSALTLIAGGCSKDTPKEELKEFSHEPYGEVELCDYKGIEVEKPIYTVSDEDIDYYIESLLYDYAETTVVDRPAKEGDCLTLYFTMSNNGEVIYDYTEEPYYLYIGDEELGAEFDSQLIGKSTGDNVKFSITYEDDYYDTEYAGKTFDYDVTIEEIAFETYPELTDEFIKNDLEYDSYDDLVAQATKDIEAENDLESEYSLNENIIQYIIDNSTFTDYSSLLYASCKNSIENGYEEYAAMFGCSSVEEVYEMFGMTEDTKEAEIINQVYKIIAIDAISQKENLALTLKEYNEGVAKYANDMDYETIEDLIVDYGEESLYLMLLEEKVLDYLIDNANITEVDYSEDEMEE